MKPLHLPDLSHDELDRFWSKVATCEDPDQCWNWYGATNKAGYGRFKVDRRLYLAHRISYSLIHGKPIRGIVMHSCDNPRCCNPMHLADASRSANSRDMSAKMRFVKSPARDCHPRAKLTTAQVAEIQKDCRTDRALAAVYGVGKSLISSVRAGRRKNENERRLSNSLSNSIQKSAI